MNSTSSIATRTNPQRPAEAPEGATKGGEPVFDWAALVPLLVHPIKVAVIEALCWMGLPLSATDLNKTLDGGPGVRLISYHLRELAKMEVIEEVSQRQVRGAVEHYYFFPDQGAANHRIAVA